MPAPALSTVAEPYAQAEIVRELGSLHEQSTTFWNGFSDADFFAPLGEAWSPADNVRHLEKSIRPVARALRLPRPLLWIAFGSARDPSRRYDAIRTIYQQRLSEGVTAGPYAPTPRPSPADPTTARRELMAQREATARALASAIERWSERALDRRRLPHPALGKLTVREMLFFTLYHNLHHVMNVARRSGSTAETTR